MVNITIRGWRDGAILFADMIAADSLKALVENAIPQLVRRHIAILADGPHMIEIEFLDAPADDPARFFRFGIDPRGMVQPIPLQALSTQAASGTPQSCSGHDEPESTEASEAHNEKEGS